MVILMLIIDDMKYKMLLFTSFFFHRDILFLGTLSFFAMW